jgi:hypothetical protein
MKQLSILLLAIVLSIGWAQAQSDDHIKFMGLSISGSFPDIKPKLERAGYKFFGTGAADTYRFMGKMDGKTVQLTIIVTPITKQVISMNFDYPVYQNRGIALEDYQSMSYTLSGMTGEAACITDERNLQAGLLAETKWVKQDGTIKLTLSSDLGISILFVDRINGIAYFKENKSLGNL